MTCECDDGPTLYSAREIVARKPHTCCECGATIPAGDTYERVKGLWDGAWATYATCERCADLRESVASKLCVNFGELFDAYEYLVGAGRARKIFRFEMEVEG